MGGRGSAGSRSGGGGSGVSGSEEKFEYKQNPELADWSKAEERRTSERTKKSMIP